MPQDYSLAALLPFARSAIRPMGNFEIRNFVDALFTELEKAGVPGVVKMNPPSAPHKYNYGNLVCPYDLQRGTAEVFFHLVHRGYILPEVQSFPIDFNYGRHWKTPRGTAWAEGSTPLPEDALGYIRHLLLLAPSLDSVIRQYIEEGLGAFARGSFFPAAVMIGAASEKEIYLLAGSLVPALKDPTE